MGFWFGQGPSSHPAYSYHLKGHHELGRDSPPAAIARSTKSRRQQLGTGCNPNELLAMMSIEILIMLVSPLVHVRRIARLMIYSGIIRFEDKYTKPKEVFYSFYKIARVTLRRLVSWTGGLVDPRNHEGGLLMTMMRLICLLGQRSAIAKSSKRLVLAMQNQIGKAKQSKFGLGDLRISIRGALRTWRDPTKSRRCFVSQKCQRYSK